MAGAQIGEYAIAWHQQRGCQVKIRLEGVSQWHTILVSSTELAAIAAILNEKPVFWKDGWIYTGPEPTGD